MIPIVPTFPVFVLCLIVVVSIVAVTVAVEVRIVIRLINFESRHIVCMGHLIGEDEIQRLRNLFGLVHSFLG